MTDDVTQIRLTPAQEPSCSTCLDTGIAGRYESNKHGRHYVTAVSGGPCPDCAAGLMRLMEVPILGEAHPEGASSDGE